MMLQSGFLTSLLKIFVGTFLCAFLNLSIVSAETWSVEDSIAIDEIPFAGHAEGVAARFVYSPGKDLVAYVNVRSELASNRRYDTLHIYSIKDLARFLQGGPLPEAIFEWGARSSSSQKRTEKIGPYEGIENIQWAPDGKALFFVFGEPKRKQLFRWRRGSEKADSITNFEHGITYYEIASPEEVLLFVPSHGGVDRRPEERAWEPLSVVSQSLQDIVGIEASTKRLVRSHRIFVASLGDRVTFRTYDLAIQAPPFGSVSISPNGRYAAVTEKIQSEWTGRCWRSLYRETLAGAHQRVMGRQLTVLDLTTGEMVQPFRGPLSEQVIPGAPRTPIAVWSNDSTQAITASTLTDGARCNLKNRDSHFKPATYVFSVDGSREKIIDYEFTDIGEFTYGPKSVRWGVSSDSVIIKSGAYQSVTFRHPTLGRRDEELTFHRRIDRRWAPVGAPTDTTSFPETASRKTEPAIRLEVREDYNTPPAVFAVTADGEARLFHDLAPHARQKRFGSVEIVKWKASDGIEWTGLLALPLNYKQGEKRLPLILQTHGFTEGKFFAEGPSTSAYPGRAALMRGFAVLTVNDSSNRNVKYGPRPTEGGRALNGYRLAISVLEKRGVVDPKRVGIIGWSRTAYYVAYAITKDPNLFASAVIADGLDYGYTQSIITYNALDKIFYDQYRAAYGDAFWHARADWLADAPGFNVEKVSIPVRIEAYGFNSAFYQWEFFAGLRLLNKPADFAVYPAGEHMLVSPSYRQASTQVSLDWLDYWINGNVNAGSEKLEQYQRWDALREEYDTYYDR